MSERPPASPERCSVRSAAEAEPMRATASTIRSWLLLEHPGPWGVHAPLDTRLRDGAGAALREIDERLAIRVLLIRRPGAPTSPGPRLAFAVRSGPGEPWIGRTELASLEDVLGLDLEALHRGAMPAGFEGAPGPLFLICTHGRHDPCCAERGRPLAVALAARFAKETWESSHVGGDRFAGNVVTFPHGLYFGRVEAKDASALAEAYAGGRIDLAHFRGRSCYATPVQAAEHFLRAERSLTGVDEIRPTRASRDGRLITVTMRTPAGAFDVTVERSRAEPRVLTCHDREPFAAPVHRLVAIRPTG